MTSEERQMLADLFERIRATSATSRDPQAESFIADAVRSLPYAPYVLAQTVLVQQQALEGAASRIAELEAQTRQGGAPAQETSFLGSLGRSLFGGGSAPPPNSRQSYDSSAYQRSAPPPNYPPQPNYAPQQPQGPWGAASGPAGGGGFLSGALHTAAGVAGGVLLGNALEGMFRGGGGGGLFGGGLASSGSRETINNYYESDPAGQHAQDVLQDMDQDQDDIQDASDSGGWDDSSDN